MHPPMAAAPDGGTHTAHTNPSEAVDPPLTAAPDGGTGVERANDAGDIDLDVLRDDRQLRRRSRALSRSRPGMLTDDRELRRRHDTPMPAPRAEADGAAYGSPQVFVKTVHNDDEARRELRNLEEFCMWSFRLLRSSGPGAYPQDARWSKLYPRRGALLRERLEAADSVRMEFHGDVKFHLNDTSRNIQRRSQQKLAVARADVERRLEALEADDVHERLDDFERKAIAYEEQIEGHLKQLFLEAEVLDRRADCVDEAFEQTLDRFDVKAQKLNAQMENFKRDAASILDAVSVSKERKRGKRDLESAPTGRPSQSECFGELRKFL